MYTSVLQSQRTAETSRKHWHIWEEYQSNPEHILVLVSDLQSKEESEIDRLEKERKGDRKREEIVIILILICLNIVHYFAYNHGITCRWYAKMGTEDHGRRQFALKYVQTCKIFSRTNLPFTQSLNTLCCLNASKFKQTIVYWPVIDL